jgi:hypothetical protein
MSQQIDFLNGKARVEAKRKKTERPTDSTILVRLIARICTTGGNLHRVDS